ncbi:37439_t:CDS:2, partial [Gigaspora margarita]
MLLLFLQMKKKYTVIRMRFSQLEATDTGEEEQAVYFKNERDKIIRQIYHLRKH